MVNILLHIFTWHGRP